MGFFGKDRHGKMITVQKGFKYIWKVEDISQAHKIGVLDSPIVPAYTGVDFHFHMTVEASGEISVYMHYKSTPIPKYTYIMGGESGLIPRQHTAFRIPETTERCGHCNVTTLSALKKCMADEDDTLLIHFQWDSDTLSISGNASSELLVQWNVDDVLKQKINPMTSKAFFVNNAIYAMRLDEMGESDVVVFIFAKEGTIVPHSLSLSNGKEVFMAAEAKEDSGANILRFPRKTLEEACSYRGQLVVTARFEKKNPLNFLNLGGGPGGPPPAFGGGGASQFSTVPPPETKNQIDLGKGEKGKMYDVLPSDI